MVGEPESLINLSCLLLHEGRSQDLPRDAARFPEDLGVTKINMVGALVVDNVMSISFSFDLFTLGSLVFLLPVQFSAVIDLLPS